MHSLLLPVEATSLAAMLLLEFELVTFGFRAADQWWEMKVRSHRPLSTRAEVRAALTSWAFKLLYHPQRRNKSLASRSWPSLTPFTSHTWICSVIMRAWAPVRCIFYSFLWSLQENFELLEFYPIQGHFLVLTSAAVIHKKHLSKEVDNREGVIFYYSGLYNQGNRES